MSFIGNLLGGYGASQLGKYNQSVANEQAKIDEAKAEVRNKIYQSIEKPKLIRDLDTAYADFKVSVFKSGVEFRPGETSGLVALRNKQNIINEIAMADYNNTVSVNDLKNQSILLMAKGEGERFKGDIARSAEYAKATGSLLTMGYNSKKAGRLVL
tara:strand:+ start:392 stop:859 length:468 start_codon:yes stop_codon:yes gene_type:complete